MLLERLSRKVGGGIWKRAGFLMRLIQDCSLFRKVKYRAWFWFLHFWSPARNYMTIVVELYAGVRFADDNWLFYR